MQNSKNKAPKFNKDIIVAQRDEAFIFDVLDELQRARSKYPNSPTIEHALYVLRREGEEMHDEVKSGKKGVNEGRLYAEAVQSCAMHFRLVSEAMYNNGMGK